MFCTFLTVGGVNVWEQFSHISGGTKFIRYNAISLLLSLLLICAPITHDKTVVISGTINPPFWIKGLRLIFKLIFC